MIMAGVYPASVSVARVGTTSWGAYQEGAPKSTNAIQQEREGTADQTFHRQPPLSQKPSPWDTPEQVLPSDAEKWTTAQTTVIGLAIGAGILVLAALVFFMTNQSIKPSTDQPVVENSEKPSPRPLVTTTAERTAKLAAHATTPPAIPPSSQFAPSFEPLKPSKPLPNPIVDDSVLYRDASGRTYRVSNFDYTRLSGMKSALDIKSRALGPAKSAISSADAELESKRRYLDSTNKYAVDSFNRLVDHRNQMHDQLKAKLADYNLDVDTFNAELERVGTLIH